MKFYVAGRFALPEMKKLIGYVRLRGHEITCDWTAHPPLKPYDQHVALSRQCSAECLEGIEHADVFVLISNEAGTGMYTEFGYALARHRREGKPAIYVVGEHTSRSMFFFDQSVQRLHSLEEILRIVDEKKNHRNEIVE